MSSDSSASAPSPSSSRLRLSVPVSNTVPIDASELVTLLSEHPLANGGGYGPTTVLDVRPADSHAGGHLRGSVHVPFDVNSEKDGEINVDDVLAKLQAAGTKRLIVLDSGARQQAPVVAELLLAKLKDSQQNGAGSAAAGAAAGSSGSDGVSVSVLTSGFAGVLNEHVSISSDRSSVSLKDDALSQQLIEHFDPKLWQAVAVARTPSNAALPHSANMLVYKQQLEAASLIVSTNSPKAE
jgi:rhodanese-related sulfurtransferase